MIVLLRQLRHSQSALGLCDSVFVSATFCLQAETARTRGDSLASSLASVEPKRANMREANSQSQDKRVVRRRAEHQTSVSRAAYSVC